MRPVTTREIDDALGSYGPLDLAEFSEFANAAAESDEFTALLYATLKLLSQASVVAVLARTVLVAIRAGMKIQQKRQEVELLERMYGEGAEAGR